MSESHASIENFRRVRDDLGTILKRLADIAEERGDLIVDNQSATAKIADTRGDFKRSLAEILNERSRNVLAKEAFRVAVVGEFNSGKSTLINTLLGRKVLSIDFKPRTATKTILRYGKKDAFCVTYTDGSKGRFTETDRLAEEIEKVTSDDARALVKGKSSVAAQIKEVEIWCNANFLNRKETEIIDTPGLGSVHPEHKKVTFSTITEVDATLFLFPCTPGIGDEDINVLAFIRQHINHSLFIMTKIDFMSLQEWQQQLKYCRDIIEQIASIPVDRIYGVSAKYQFQKKTNESGFDSFLDGLESFLISSSGVVRLQVPFDVALTNCEELVKNTQLDRQRIDDDVETLRAELKRLEDTQSEIEKGRESLIKKVDNSMEDMTANALDGIDELPTRIEKAVNNALEDFNKESLKKVDIKLQTIINDTVEKWVSAKDKSFGTQAELLQNLVESELKRFVKIVDDAMQLPVSSTESSSTSIPIMSALGSGRDVRLVFGTAAKAAGTLAAGWGTASILYFLTSASVVVPLTLVLLIPLIPIIGDIVNDEGRIRNDIKRQFENPIPGNTVTIFEAVVEGYKDSDGSHHAGLREKLQTHFNDWGSNLKTEINNFVSNLTSNQLTQIENQIHEKETKKFDREQRQKMYSEHEEKLDKIGAELTDLGTIIQSMSSSNEEQSSSEVKKC